MSSEGTTRGRRQYRNVGKRGNISSNRGVRSMSQFRRSKSQEDSDNQALLDNIIRKSEKPTPQSMEKKNPGKQNPQPTEQAIKLDHYVGDWIDTDRNNIQVEMKESFEDQILNEHIKYIVVDSDALQYEDPRDVEVLSLGWMGYSLCNLAYRLILTLPSSNRVEVSDFLRELHDAEQPRNTPAYAEMLSHIGKSDVPHYGRLRIDGPVLQAKRRIARAVYTLKDTKPWSDEFMYDREGSPENIDWRNGIWKDRDSWDWLRRRAVNFIHEELRKHRSFDDMDDDTVDTTALKFRFCLPFVEVADRSKQGMRNVYPPQDVINYWGEIKFLKKEQIDKIMAAFILIAIPFDFFKTEDVSLKDHSNAWNHDNFAYAGETMDGLLAYLGIPRMDTIMNMRLLRYNYFVIVNNYNSSVRARIDRIFETTVVSKEEFGDESQAIECTEPDIRGNPYLRTSFLFDNKQHIAAGGIFNYAFRVQHKLAQEMLMKRTRPSMIAELVSKFGKGRK